MDKKILEIFGIALVFIGFFLIIIQPFSTITGAVIDLSHPFSKMNFLLGLFLILGGFGLIFWKKLD